MSDPPWMRTKHRPGRPVPPPRSSTPAPPTAPDARPAAPDARPAAPDAEQAAPDARPASFLSAPTPAPRHLLLSRAVRPSPAARPSLFSALPSSSTSRSSTTSPRPTAPPPTPAPRLSLSMSPPTQAATPPPQAALPPVGVASPVPPARGKAPGKKVKKALSYLKGELMKGDYNVILKYLSKTFKNFTPALLDYCRQMAMSEAAALAKSNSQKLPENISVEELFNFNMRAEFETLRDGAPMLYHVICGAMGVEKKDLKNPTRHLPGGTCAEVTLYQAITQVMSQCHAISHPRKRSLLALVNGVLGLLKHHNEKTFKLQNGCGASVSKQSARKVVDRFVRGKNKVRKNWQLNNRSRARMRSGSKKAPGKIVIGDNLGQTKNPRHMDNPKKRGGYVKMTQFLAVENRVPSAHYSDVPLPNGSPLKLLKSGAFIPTENEFETVLPYEKYVLMDSLTTHIPELKKFKKDFKLPTHKKIRLMSERSNVEPLGVIMLDPSSNHDMIKMGQKMNQYAPLADKHTGERRKVLHLGDLAFKERLLHTSWTVSEERIMESIVPFASGFHRDMAWVKLMMNMFWHMDEVNMPGTLANTKVKFHHRKAGKEVKDYYACVDLLESHFHLTVAAFAKDLMATSTPVSTFQDLEKLVDEMLAVFHSCREKYKMGGGLKSCPNLSVAAAADRLLELVVPQDVPAMAELPVDPPYKAARLESQSDFLDAEDELEVVDGGQGDQGGSSTPASPPVPDARPAAPDARPAPPDQFRDYMLKGFCYYALNLFTAKLVCRLGDGVANNAIWMLWMMEFFDNGHVKYAIECLQRRVAVKGGFGRHIMKDITWSAFVNTKGLPHSNIHADIHMEHENAEAKENMRAAGGNLTTNVAARASRMAPLRRLLEEQVYPTYTESGEGTNRQGYRGHGDADWREQVDEGLRDMKGILEVHPGRSRVHHGLKDWSIEKTHRIDWSKVGPFMRKHAKKTDDYISETFDRVSELPKDLDLDSYSEEEPDETSDHEDELDVIVPQYSDEEAIVQIGELDD